MGIALLFPPSLGPVTASARAEMLSSWLGQRLGTWVEVEVAGSYDELLQRIEQADVDLAWASPAICARVAHRARAIFKAVRRGSSMYQAAIVVQDESLKKVGDVSGKRAAWVDRLSAGGHLLAVSHLRGVGIAPEAMQSTFVGSYGDAIRAVLTGDADVTSVFVHEPSEEGLRRSLSEFVGAGDAAKLRALAFTDRAPADGLVVTDREESGGNEVDVDALARVLEDSTSAEPLLSVLDADALVRASAHDYDALRA